MSPPRSPLPATGDAKYTGYTPGPAYPLPVAPAESVEKLLALYQGPYRDQYGRDLTYDEAKRFLEGLMQFLYLTEIDDALRPLRQEIQRERGPAGPEY